MPEPTTTRDRELALAALDRYPNMGEMTRELLLESIGAVVAEARREGWKNGRRDGVTESAIVALCEAIYLRKHLDDQHQADGAERVEKRLTALLDQPAPEAKE